MALPFKPEEKQWAQPLSLLSQPTRQWSRDWQTDSNIEPSKPKEARLAV